MNRQKLCKNVYGVIYTFLSIQERLHSLSKLSKGHRDLIRTHKPQDSRLALKIPHNLRTFNEIFQYPLEICTKIDLTIDRDANLTIMPVILNCITTLPHILEVNLAIELTDDKFYTLVSSFYHYQFNKVTFRGKQNNKTIIKETKVQAKKVKLQNCKFNTYFKQYSLLMKTEDLEISDCCCIITSLQGQIPNTFKVKNLSIVNTLVKGDIWQLFDLKMIQSFSCSNLKPQLLFSQDFTAALTQMNMQLTHLSLDLDIHKASELQEILLILSKKESIKLFKLISKTLSAILSEIILNYPFAKIARGSLCFKRTAIDIPMISDRSQPFNPWAKKFEGNDGLEIKQMMYFMDSEQSKKKDLKNLSMAIKDIQSQNELEIFAQDCLIQK